MSKKRKKKMNKKYIVLFLALFLAFGSISYAETYVYVTKTGEKYHKENCQYVRGKTNLKVYSINEVPSKYEPCSKCRPDKMIEEESHASVTTPGPTPKPTEKPTPTPSPTPKPTPTTEPTKEPSQMDIDIINDPFFSISEGAAMFAGGGAVTQIAKKFFRK